MIAQNNVILVTGGAGFVGHHLVAFLLKKGHRVIVIDDLSTGNIQNLNLSDDNLEFHHGTICNTDLLSNLAARSDLVIHLAAVVGMRNVIANPLKTIEVNINCTNILAQLCGSYNLPLVFFSSSAVYRGNNREELYSEGDVVHNYGLNNFSLYAESKVIGETICEAHKGISNLKYIIIRPFNLIGTGQSSEYGMVVPAFIRSASTGEKLPIYGDGNQKRTFSNVDDAIEILWALLINEKNYNDIYNLASNEDAISIKELVQMICLILGSEAEFQYFTYSQVYGPMFTDAINRKPSLRKLRQTIKIWNPRSLKDTLHEIVEAEVKTAVY